MIAFYPGGDAFNRFIIKNNLLIFDDRQEERVYKKNFFWILSKIYFNYKAYLNKE